MCAWSWLSNAYGSCISSILLRKWICVCCRVMAFKCIPSCSMSLILIATNFQRGLMFRWVGSSWGLNLQAACIVDPNVVSDWLTLPYCYQLLLDCHISPQVHFKIFKIDAMEGESTVFCYVHESVCAWSWISITSQVAVSLCFCRELGRGRILRGVGSLVETEPASWLHCCSEYCSRLISTCNILM